MEPITSALLASVLLPIVVNRLDEHGVGRVIDRARELIESGDRPVNHDLRRASRRAYLLATKELCLVCLEESGVPTRRRRILAGLLPPRSAPGQFDAMLERLKSELKHLKPAPEIDTRFEFLLQPRGERVEKRTRELKQALKAHLLEELEGDWEIDVPERFKIRLEEGWQEPGAEARIDWFDLVSLFFVEDLKRNEKLERAFSTEILAELPDIAVGVKELEEKWDEYAQAAMPLLKRLDLTIAELYEHQRDQFDLVQRNLAEATDAMSAEVGDVREAVLEVRDLVLMTSRSQLSEANASQLVVESRAIAADYRWRDSRRGRRVARAVLALIRDYQQWSFVGREADLRELNDFLELRRSGRLVVTARAGYGKTALLANWVGELEERGVFTAFHFFSPREESTTSLMEGYRHLFRRLQVYNPNATGEPPEDERALKDEIDGLVRSARAVGERERLVIVIDGLDEAEDMMDDPFGDDPLPDGVYVVVSGRAAAGDQPGYLKIWAERAGPNGHLHLERLNEDAIAEWLQRAGDGELARYGRDRLFVEQVASKTDGFPLHVHFLVEEMRRLVGEEDPLDVLARTPVGFAHYVRDQLERLWTEGQGERIRNVFAFLAVSKGPLRRSELKELTKLLGELFDDQGMLDDHFIDLRQDWRMRRWFHISTDGPGREEESYSFAQPFLARAFADEIGDRASKADSVLRQWCTRWRDHEYPLRHYPENLLDEVSERHEGHEYDDEIVARDELYRLAREPDFRDAQLAAFPAEPDLPLRTLQKAILAAAKTDDAAAMVEFLLLHVRAISELRESPLTALDHFGGEAARRQADYAASEESVLWYLLIAWRLNERAEGDQARDTLGALLRKDPRRLSSRYEGAAACALAALARHELVAALVERLLSDGGRRLFDEQVAAREGRLQASAEPKSVDEVLKAAPVAGDGIQDDDRPTREDAETTLDVTTRTLVLLDVARAQAEDRATEEAEATCGAARDLASALGQALEWERVLDRVRANWDWRSAPLAVPPLPDERFRHEIERLRSWVAQVTANSADEADALSRVRKARVGAQERAVYLSGLAWAEADRGDRTEAATTFESAHAAVSEVEAGLRPYALIALGDAALQTGFPDAAKRTFTSVRHEIRALSDPFERARAFASLAERERDGGLRQEGAQDFGSAMEAATSVGDHLLRVLAFLAISKTASGGDRAAAFDAARHAAQEPADPADRLGGLKAIADEVTGAGEEGPHAGLRWAEEARLAPDEKAFFLLAIAVRAAATESTQAQALHTLALAGDAFRSFDVPLERSANLGLIALIQAELGEGDQAERNFSTAIEVAREVEGEQMQGILLASIAYGQACAGRFDSASRTAALIEDREVAVFAHWCIAGVQAERGDVHGAMSSLAAACRASEALAEAGDVALGLVAIADGYARTGPGRGTLSALDEMSPHAARLDAEDAPPRVRAAVLASTASASAAAGDASAAEFATASDVAGTIEPRADRASFLSAIGYLAARARQGDLAARVFETAIRYAGDVEDPLQRAMVLADIARTAAMAGLSSALAAADEDARAAVLDVENVTARIVAWLALARAGRYAGVSEAPRDLLLTALEDALQLPAGEERAFALLTIARGQATLGYAEDATTTLRSIPRATDELPPARRAAYETAIPLVLIGAAPEERDVASVVLRRRAISLLLEIARVEVDIAPDAQPTETVAAARELVDGFENEEEKAAALDAIARVEKGESKGSAEHELPAEGTRVADRSVLTAPGPDPRVDAIELARAGEADAAITAFSSLLARRPEKKEEFSTWALAAIARAQAKSGSADAAAQTAAEIEDERVRTATLSDIRSLATNMAEAENGATAAPAAAEGPRQEAERGLNGAQRTLSGAREGVKTLRSAALSLPSEKQILSLGGRYFLREAARYADRRDRDGFESNLVPCAYYPEVAAEMCALLASVYPRQVPEIVAAVKGFSLQPVR